MAKAVKEIKKFEFSKVASILSNISKNVPILVDDEVKEDSYISTGSYMLNACLSGSLFGGIGSRGITTIAGPEASGKTYIALNTMREAQKAGYCVVYIDTEYAINRANLPKYNLDNSPEKFVIVRGNQVEDINIALSTLIDELKQAKLDGFELPKQIWCLDSLAQMSSRKMKEDLISKNIKADVGNKAKAIGSMFISITADINYLEIPFLCLNQTYDTLEMFSTTVMKGGRQLYYSSNNIVFLTKAKLKEEGASDEMDIVDQTGIVVTAKCVKNRKVKPKQVKIEISFEKGMNPYRFLENFCRPEYFEKTGIAIGRMEVDKKTGESTFVPGGKKWYVKHLNKYFFLKNLHIPEVFTQDVLEAIDEITQNYFQYKSIEEKEESEKEFNKIVGDDEEDDESGGFEDADSLDGGDFFAK